MTRYKPDFEEMSEARNELCAMSDAELKHEWNVRGAYHEWYVDLIESEMERRNQQ